MGVSGQEWLTWMWTLSGLGVMDEMGVLSLICTFGICLIASASLSGNVLTPPLKLKTEPEANRRFSRSPAGPRRMVSSMRFSPVTHFSAVKMDLG